MIEKGKLTIWKRSYIAKVPGDSSHNRVEVPFLLSAYNTKQLEYQVINAYLAMRGKPPSPEDLKALEVPEDSE